MAAKSPGDVESYILSSKYRKHVLRHLAVIGPSTPKEIADSTDDRRPHASRALSELREKGIVELKVSESRTVGRYYGLTVSGEEAWANIKDKIQEITWTIEDPTEDVTRSVVELANEEFGSQLRIVGLYDGEEITILYADSDVLSNYSDEEFEQGLRTLVFEHALSNVNVHGSKCCSEVINFEEFSILRVRIGEDTQISISFDNSHNIQIPSFAKSVASVFNGSQSE
ncbi:winged helix-turn-helix domain-containing protein [Halorussus amylolyticus]|uniref:winged helix-turn-helix domain-containing protein n=1 Tax=Halorussus amylolyticus TaxID=1126242 RepID=UPI0034A2DDAF